MGFINKLGSANGTNSNASMFLLPQPVRSSSGSRFARKLLEAELLSGDELLCIYPLINSDISKRQRLTSYGNSIVGSAVSHTDTHSIRQRVLIQETGLFAEYFLRCPSKVFQL